MECQTVEKSNKLLCCHVDNTMFIFIIFDPGGFDSLIQYPNILIPSTITTTFSTNFQIDMPRGHLRFETPISS